MKKNPQEGLKPLYVLTDFFPNYKIITMSQRSALQGKKAAKYSKTSPLKQSPGSLQFGFAELSRQQAAGSRQQAAGSRQIIHTI